MYKVFAALAVILGLWVAGRAAAETTPEPLAPIIAQLVAEPENYAGKVVMIYGLVVESQSAGRTFMLQDVSQHPLRVVGDDKVKADVGDQVTVIGIFKVDRGAPYVAANILIPTRVLAGGGCC